MPALGSVFKALVEGDDFQYPYIMSRRLPAALGPAEDPWPTVVGLLPGGMIDCLSCTRRLCLCYLLFLLNPSEQENYFPETQKPRNQRLHLLQIPTQLNYLTGDPAREAGRPSSRQPELKPVI